MDTAKITVVEWLADLTSKIGLTAEHLWAPLVRYVLYSAIGDVVACILMVIVLGCVFLFLRRGYKRACESDSRLDEEGWQVGVNIVGVVALIAVILLVISLSTLIATIASPEGAAIKALIPGSQ